MEDALNQRTNAPETRAKKAAELLPEPAYADAEASGEYRLFVFENTLRELLEGWEYGTI